MPLAACRRTTSSWQPRLNNNRIYGKLLGGKETAEEEALGYPGEFDLIAKAAIEQAHQSALEGGNAPDAELIEQVLRRMGRYGSVVTSKSAASMFERERIAFEKWSKQLC